jgi:hypothetical protein
VRGGWSLVGPARGDAMLGVAQGDERGRAGGVADLEEAVLPRDEEHHENRLKNCEFAQKLMELGAKNWRSCRSPQTTSDLWTKTTKNATNPQIKFRAIFWGNFWGKFLGENWRDLWSNSWQPLL